MGRSYTSKGTPTPFDFELDGVEFVMPGGVMLLDLSDLARVADEEAGSPAGVAAMGKIFRTGLRDGYERFAEHCRVHDTDPETLLTIMGDLVEHVTGRPTVRSGSSSPGPLTMNGSVKVSLPETPLTDEEIARWRESVRQASTRTPG